MVVWRYMHDHPTVPFLIVAALITPAFVLTLMPFQVTLPSSSVLKCSAHFSRTFFLGLRRGWIAPWAKSSSNPSRKTLSPLSPSGIRSSTAVCSALEAQTTIPLELNPARGLGFRLAITNTFPFICSRGTYFWSPDAISLTSPQTRIFSQ